MVDQRKDKRAPASLKVKYKSATVDQLIGQLATDVSRGGMFVKTKTPLALGSLIKLELQLSDASPVIQGIGRVCWRREATSDAAVIPGMGIKFVKVDPDSRSVVERIVQSRGDRPSRFDQSDGAEIAPPSISPPPASGAPPPITAPPPSPSVPAAPARAPVAARVPTAAPAGSVTAHAPLPTRPASGPHRAPLPSGDAHRAPLPSGDAHRAPLPSGDAHRAPLPSGDAHRAPLPSGGSSAANLPVPAPASAPLSVPKVAPSKQGAGRAVAGLFADSPLSRSSGADPNADVRARSSFFGTPPAAASSNAGVPRPNSARPNSARPNSARPTSGRSEQARQSGQFLATAFAEGGLAADTTAQARAAAEAHNDEVDDLFDEVVKTSEHPAPPPAAAKSAPLAAQTSAERESVDDMFAELSEEEGLASVPPPRASGSPFAAVRAKPHAAPAQAAGFDIEERTTERTSVDELLDGLSDEPGAPEPAEAADEFGEADVGAASSVSPSAPPMLRMSSDAPAAPLEVAQAMQRSSSSTPILIALIVVAAAAFGGFYFYKQRVAQQNAQAAQQQAPSAAAPAAPPAAAPSAEPAPAANAEPAAPAQPSKDAPPAQAAAPQAAAPAQKPAGDANAARVEVEVSSLPRGAEISVDGKAAGTTPTRVTLVVDKPTEVKVTSAGYAAMARSLVPSANNEPLRFKLEPLPYALVVRSTPPDVQISFGDKVATAPAPLDLGHLDGGVQVSISKDGFQRMTRLVRLDEFSEQDGVMRAAIEVKLNPLPGGAAQPQAQPQPQRTRPKPQTSRAREAPPAPPSEPETPAAPSGAAEPKLEPKPAVEVTPAPAPKTVPSSLPSAAPTPPTPPAPPTPP